MPAAYPSTLPLPLLDKTREQPAAFQVAQPRRGFGYVELTGTDTPVFWDLTWRLTGSQAQTFRGWFVFTLARGSLPFLMTVRTEFGLVEHELQLLPDGLMPARQVAADVWEYRATAMARAEIISGFDPDFASVVALMTGNGTDGAAVATPEQSSFARAVTLNGAVTLEDTQVKFGPTSIRFDSSNTERVRIAADASAALGTNDCTIEFFYRGDSAASAYGLVSNGSAFNANGLQISTKFNGTDATLGKILVSLNSGPVVTIESANGTATEAVWHFVQLRRSGNTWSLYVDGTFAASGTSSFTPSDLWFLGVEAQSSGTSFGNYLNGYMEQFRVTRGVLRPTSVPVEAFPTR